MPALRVLKNVPGPFFVYAGECIACELCVVEAPDLMVCDDTQEDWTCYFTKQPETPEEVERALRAYDSCCVGAVNYEGDDPVILARIEELKVIEAQRRQEYALAAKLKQSSSSSDEPETR